MSKTGTYYVMSPELMDKWRQREEALQKGSLVLVGHCITCVWENALDCNIAREAHKASKEAYGCTQYEVKDGKKTDG